MFVGIYLVGFISKSFHAYERLTSSGIHYTSVLAPSGFPLPFPLLSETFIPLFVGGVVLLLLIFIRKAHRWLLLSILVIAIYLYFVDLTIAGDVDKLMILFFLLATLMFFLTEKKATVIPIWPIRMLQLTLVIVYLNSGLCKIVRGDWLLYNDVLRSVLQGTYCSDVGSLFMLYAPSWMRPLLSWGVLLDQVVLVFLLLSSKWKWIPLTIGVMLHIGIMLLMHNLWYFSSTMIAWYLFFLNQDEWSWIKTHIRAFVTRYISIK